MRRKHRPVNPWGTSEGEGVIEDLGLHSSDPYGFVGGAARESVLTATLPAPKGRKYTAKVCWFLPVRPNRLKGEMRRWIDLDRLEKVGEKDE